MSDEFPELPEGPPAELVGATLEDQTTATGTLVAACPNCNTRINGPFCSSCGQRQTNLNKYFWTITGEVMDDVFRLDSRTSRTLFALLCRPGFLTTEYFKGRRARYVPPIRLYFIISFLFFFILPILSSLDPDSGIVIDSDDTELIEFGSGTGIKGTVTLDDETVDIDTDDEDWRKDIEEGLAEIHLDLLSEEQNDQLSKTLQQQVEKTMERFKDEPGDLAGEFLDLLSAVMFFLLPIFAICLKLAYIGKGVYYTEHLLLAVHNHCFLFIALLTTALLDLGQGTSVATVTTGLDTLIQIWIPVYMYLSLRKTYRQGHLTTLVKFFMLGMSYCFLALMGLVFAIIFGVMTL